MGQILLDNSVLIMGLTVLVYFVNKDLVERGILSPLFKKQQDFDDSFYLRQIQRKYLKGNVEFVGRGIKLGNEISYITVDKDGSPVRIFKER